jgi:hypothetical protein
VAEIQVAVRDPVTGRWLKGNPGGQPGRMTEARRERIKLEEKVAAIDSDEMPLDHLLRVMRTPGESPAVRFQAAKAAAPYGPDSSNSTWGYYRRSYAWVTDNRLLCLE